jgi:hypothetical protein
MKLFPQVGLVAAVAAFAEGKAWSATVVEIRELISGQNPQSAMTAVFSPTSRLQQA